MEKTAFYRTIWRWHFYAGLLVIPFVLILSVTGAIYLFKPQVERWEERAWQGLPEADAVSPDAQREAALNAFPGSLFRSYRLPQREGDAALIQLGLPGRLAMRDVFVSPQGKVLGALDPQWRIMQIDHGIHGELLLGHTGSWLVELAASWAIVLILSGLFLWWPQGKGLTGVLWPRLSGGNRVFWRDLHAVAGFWVAGLAMALLITGLPWAGVWGSAFKTVRSEAGLIKGKQDWTIGGAAPDADEHAMHSEHDPGAMMRMNMPAHIHGMTMGMSPVLLSEIVARAKGERLAFPVIVTPPSAPQRFGAKQVAVWTVKSDAQNRPLRVTITYDAITGAQTSREDFADKHPIDRVVGYGIAWHEGQLLGLFNQLVGVATALLLITLSLSGFVLWRRRKPEGGLGAPPLPPVPARIGGVTAIILILAGLLPLLAASLVVVWLLERVIIARIPAASRWLGLSIG